MNLLTKTLLSMALMSTMKLPGTAQSYPNSLGVSLGTFSLQTLDQQASPLRHTGTLRPLYGLSYRHHTHRSQFNLRLSGGAGTMNPDRFGTRTYSTTFSDGTPFSYQIASELYHFKLQADYLWRIGSAQPGRLNTWVGGSLQESAFYADEVANFPWLVSTATISPLVQTDYALSSHHKLTVRLDMAVVGLITRAIWAGFPKSTSDNNVVAYLRQGTHPALAGKLGSVGGQVGYDYRVSPHLSLSATYRAHYVSYPDPRPVRMVNRSFALEGVIHF